VFNQTQKNPTLKIPPSKAWRRLHRANATSPRAAHCIATSSQRIGSRIASRAAQRIASQPVRSASARASHPVQRSALPRIPCIAAHCIASCTAQRTARMQPARAHRPAHRKQSAHQQPTRHASPTAPAKARGFIKTLFFAHRPPHGAHLTHAVLHALRSTLRWFRLVRGTNFSKIQFIYIRIAILSCVRSSVGTEFGNLALCPGFDSGRKFSDFFYFRHFLQS
jgi:hypothetical protein